MMQKIIVYLSLGVCFAIAQLGFSIAAPDETPVEDAAPDDARVLLRLSKVDPQSPGFIARRRALLRRLENIDRTDQLHVLVELARSSLLDGLAVEGLSYIERLAAADATPETILAYRGIAAALAVIEPFSEGLSDSDVEALEMSASVPFKSVFVATARVMIGEESEAVRAISASIEELDTLPDHLAAKVLPTLLEASIGVEDWKTARSLTKQFMKREMLRESDALNYLLGQTALHHGEDIRAFDHFLLAAGGRNIWGHRSRLAIVDLAIANDSLAPAEVQEMLSTVYSLWQGDAYAVMALERKLSLALEHNDWLAALDVIAIILRHYPKSGVADTARGEIEATLAAFYGAGRNGDLSFVEFLSGHRQIARNFRFIQGYDAWSETFADHVLGLGAIGMAAAEYRTTREYLEASGKLEIFDVEPKRLSMLKLKEAEARIDAGQMDRAATLLRYEGESDGNSDHLARLSALRARYSELTGLTLEDASDAAAHSATYIRLMAQQHFADENWAEARSHYLKLVRLLGPKLQDRDAVELILAAHRSGDEELTRVLSGIIAQRYDLANDALDPELLLDRPMPLELRREVAEASLSRAGRVIEQVVELSNDEPSEAPLQQE